MEMFIPRNLDEDIKKRLEEQVRTPRESSRKETEVVYALYGRKDKRGDLIVEKFLFRNYVFCYIDESVSPPYTEHLAIGPDNKDTINDYIGLKPIGHLHSHPDRNCERILRRKDIKCNPSISVCFSGASGFSDLASYIPEIRKTMKISPRKDFVFVLYCQPEDKYVGFHNRGYEPVNIEIK